MINASSYSLSQALFLRALGVVYFFAFLSLLTQVKGLYGRHGILPIRVLIDSYRRLTQPRRVRALPTLFWLGASDFALVAACAAGVLLSLLLIFNIQPTLSLLGLTILYLSFVSVGQDFLSFQWDTLLLEVSWVGLFFSLSTPPSPFMLVAIWALLFRFMISAGVVKLLSGDVYWRSLTALDYHYESQPLPNRASWYFHQASRLFQKASTLVMFAIELVVPFFIFGPERARLFAFSMLAGFQILLMISGNLSYLNILTLTMCIPLLPDSLLGPVLGAWAPHLAPSNSPMWLDFVLGAVGLFFIFINLVHLIRFFYPKKWMARLLSHLSPIHLSGSYGLFAIMTTGRRELIVQGSNDGHDWLPYEFAYKPQNVFKAPKQIAPLHPRLDWQMWFAALHSGHFEPWLNNFLAALLHGSKDVLRLLKRNPFPLGPPKYVRVVIYDYQFTDFKTRKQTGRWWNRKLIQERPSMELKK
jgi:hypothetical protein